MAPAFAPSLSRAPADRERLVLLVSAVEKPIDFLFFNNIAPGLLRLQAGIQATCRDLRSSILIWHTLPGADPEAAFRAQLESLRPAIVGISSFSIFMPLALRIAALVRAYDPRVPVVLGGYHTAAFPAGLGRYPDIDYYVRGEGVRVGPQLFRSLLDGAPALESIPSLSLRRADRVVVTPLERLAPDMDLNPQVRWAEVDLGDFRANDVSVIGNRDHRITFRSGKFFPYETSQGCTHRCNFCERRTRGLRRAHGIPRVVAELGAIRDAFGVRNVFLSDDLVHADRERFIALLRALEQQLDLRYYAAVKADEIDRDLIDRMLAAGVRIINCFPESAAPRVRALMGKQIDMARLLDNMAYASDQGALVYATFILGWPSETRDEAEATYRLARDGPFDLISFMPLLYFGAARVGRHLSEVGIEPDTPDYFRILREPFDVCLTEYGPACYRELVDREFALNAERLQRAAVRAKFDGLGMEVVALAPPPTDGAAVAPAAAPASVADPAAVEKARRWRDFFLWLEPRLADQLADPAYRIADCSLSIAEPALRYRLVAPACELSVCLIPRQPGPAFARTQLFNVSHAPKEAFGDADQRLLQRFLARIERCEARWRRAPSPAADAGASVTLGPEGSAVA